jgi:hypothetical protein
MSPLLAAVRACLADIRAFDAKLNDPAGDGSGDNARSPTGDDYNEIMDMLTPLVNAAAVCRGEG